MMVDFNNKSSFNRFFKRLEGISPTEYRRMKLNEGHVFQGESEKKWVGANNNPPILSRHKRLY
jgi:AraC-like DNA-binding protein